MLKGNSRRRRKPIEVMNFPAWNEIGRCETVVDAESNTYTFAKD